PVLHDRHHLAFDRDLAGDVEDALSDVLPGHPPVLFVNGAVGDVSSRSAGAGGPEGAAETVRQFAIAIGPAVSEGRALERLAIRAAVTERDYGSPYAFACLGSRAAFRDRVGASVWGDDAPSVLSNVISLPANAVIWSLGLTEIRFGFTFEGAVGVQVDLGRALRGGPRPVGALRLLAEAATDGGLERQHATILWFGGEPTTELGRRWRERATAGGEAAPFLLSHTNDAMGYLTTEEEYESGSYEAMSTVYGPEAGRLVEEALFAAYGALSNSAPPR
ncbi:MAG: neutral/alkaline non-lysosomal ceramidase N-terminal domain-containing protein, partial [Planctomycetota bacterium]